MLFVELLLIRWIPANVVYLGFFRNFLLMASFLGIGAGILFGRDPTRVPPVAVRAGPAGGRRPRRDVHAPRLHRPVGRDRVRDHERATGGPRNFLILALIVMLTSIIMAAAALPLGRLLTSMPPLRAYAIDICGSMTGIAAFARYPAWRRRRRSGSSIVGPLSGLLALGAGRDALVAGVRGDAARDGRSCRFSSRVRRRLVVRTTASTRNRRGDLAGSRQRHPPPGDVAVDHPARPSSTIRSTGGSPTGRSTTC